MAELLERVNGFVWGLPALVLILGVGLYLTIRTGCAQLTLFPRALRRFFEQFQTRRRGQDGVSPYQALCTALAATVGTGNLAGVAGAIALGGPGAIFWMWVCAFFGMVTKFAEAALSVRYCRKNKNGERVGGPMQMIEDGLGKRFRWLACTYAFFGVVAAFGVGNATQINTLIGGVNSVLIAYGVAPSGKLDLLLGVLLAILIAKMLLGGAKRVGQIAERLVPFASVLYLVLGAGELIVCASEIPGAFSSIFTGAFSPRAVTGGVLGSAFTALRVGASRGVFTNEAGMGTAGIAHAAARVSHPVEQGLMGIMEVFIDTIVICTMTALVILCSGVPITYGLDQGIALTSAAFSSVYGDWITIPIMLSLCCFALATVLGWGLYGVRCAQYLFGNAALRKFVLLQAGVVVLSTVLKTGTVWLLSETVNGLMAIPNLLALAGLSPELRHLTKEFKAQRGLFTGGNYENFQRRKSMGILAHPEVPSIGCQRGKKRKENISPKYRSA